MELQINYRGIGSKLRNARFCKGLTQEQVSEKAKITNSAYSNIERGKQKPGLYTLLTLCAVLDLSPGDVLDDCCPQLWEQAQKSKADSDLKLRVINRLQYCTDNQLAIIEEMIEALHRYQP